MLVTPLSSKCERYSNVHIALGFRTWEAILPLINVAGYYCVAEKEVAIPLAILALKSIGNACQVALKVSPMFAVAIIVL